MSVIEASERILSATRSGQPGLPVRDLIGSTDVDAAYAVQRHVNDARISAGSRVIGRKIGLTSPAVQAQLGVDQPDFGVLFEDMDVTGQSVPMDRLLQPKVEAEIAFVLGADLDGDLTWDSVRAAVASAHVALEIVDSRIANWDITYADTVADNASSGLFTLGTRLADDVDPQQVTMTMAVNGEVVSTGTGEACLGDPLNALLWLAQTAKEFGDPLRTGQVILSGALGPMTPVSADDHVEAVLSLDGAPVGNIRAHFTEGGAA